ncbi:MAG: GyrI-like domain-containing protein [Oscillospiraceae bacterium]|nr:GyrI-like domain-containing protein [Oscillospiraceae bacterium]
MAGTFDFKKEYKDLYLPKEKPGVIDVPEMVFIMVDGKGNPNTSEQYKNALEILYGFSYTIKMSKKSAVQPEGYFDYVVPPLEGFWWGEDGCFDAANVINKDKLHWTSMLRQPEFVTQDVFESAKQSIGKKKPGLDLSPVRLVTFTEGLCAQIMHTGSYDNEPATIGVLERFIKESGYETDISEKRKHHEIYLNDPRKTESEKLKTVIRHPIKERN